MSIRSPPKENHMICPKCNQELDETKFYHDKSRKSGRSRKCKSCMSQYIKDRRTRPSKANQGLQSAKRHKEKYPEAKKAGMKLRRLIAKGEIKKSETCTQILDKITLRRCGKSPTIAYWVDHQYKGDPKKVVRWYCRECAYKHFKHNSLQSEPSR